MSTLNGLRAWLEDTGHSGCAEDLVTTVRDHPEDAPAIARACADHVEADTPAYAREEAGYLPAELRARAAELERRLSPAPLGGTFPAGTARVTVREPRAGTGERP